MITMPGCDAMESEVEKISELNVKLDITEVSAETEWAVD